MRIVRGTLRGLAVWGLAGAASGQALTLPELLNSMATVEARQASFVEQRNISLLDKPLVISGTLSYRRPDFLERRTEAPTRELMSVSGDRLTIEWPDRHEQRTLSLNSNPTLWAFVESIRATLAGDRATLERFYWTTLSGDARRWTLTLEPRVASVAARVKSIILTGGGNVIGRVEVLEENGDRSVMDIKVAPP
jgi:hypothetical protein